MAQKRVFGARCPQCKRMFVVDWGLRYAGISLLCPFCSTRFLPDEAAELDERS